MPNDLVSWEEAVILNQKQNIVLFEEKKNQIATCTSNERLSEMRAQVKGALLAAQEMKLRSIVEDAIELLALIRWQFAELNPPRKPGPQKDCPGAGTNILTHAERNEASRNRSTLRRSSSVGPTIHWRGSYG